MLILVAVGVMNILAMVVLIILIFAEKMLPHGLLIAHVTGVCFLGATVAAVIWPIAFPGLRPYCVF
jgi:predicted metal-binding membrane protein